MQVIVTCMNVDVFVCAVLVPGSSVSVFLSQICVHPSLCDCAVGCLMFLLVQCVIPDLSSREEILCPLCGAADGAHGLY